MGKLTKPSSEPIFYQKDDRNFSIFDTDTVELSDSLILKQFRSFVSEVLDLIKNVQIKNNDNLKEKTKKNDDDKNLKIEKNFFEEICFKTQEAISKIIELQNLELLKKGSKSEQKRLEEIRYLKAAVADELLLNTNWPGRDFFKNFLIESRLFGSSIAGEKIFSIIDEILEAPPGREPEIEQLYLFALAIGFEGKYRKENSEKIISEIMLELYKHFARKEPSLGPQNRDLDIGDRKVSPDAYKNIISNLRPIRIFKISKQFLIFTIIIFVLLLISQISYLILTKSLREVIDGHKVKEKAEIILKFNPTKRIFCDLEKEKYHG